ncbi:molybdopterin-dependent oxidoreductase [Eggerthella sinensis]|uniref:molybdopterin-dependent oxidoreductase n=1 Tax=Eggerthella sinensis TaxID=242230 RepID=UPI00266C3DC2|nr:molybdopterin-dependent oxidoreductase [Eggerthella sinensis]
MMNTGKKLAGLVAGGALVVSAAPAAQLALASEQPALDGGGAACAVQAGEDLGAAVSEQMRVSIENVQGTFAWNQGVTADNATLSQTLYQGSKYLCGAQGVEGMSEEDASGERASSERVPSVRSIRVTGDVSHAFTASVDDFVKKAPVQKVMGCTCSGNPADGRASANAEVGGFQLAALINEADPLEGANTITFTSADGYEVALPLKYVTQRYCLVVTTVNGEDTAQAIGCANQLWLGSTAARAYARDVVAISITKEAEPPAAPGASPDANVPNVGVTKGAA